MRPIYSSQPSQPSQPPRPRRLNLRPSQRLRLPLRSHDEHKAFDAQGTFKIPSVERAGPPGREADAAAHGGGSPPASDRADLVVIGNGIAGCIAAMETRQYAPDARILVISEQNHPTINTPALKQFGAGRLELEQLLAYSAGTQQHLGIGMIHRAGGGNRAIRPSRASLRWARHPVSQPADRHRSHGLAPA